MASARDSARSGRRSFPVEVTKLPVVRCQLCQTTIAHRPGQASDVLTRHYEQEHPATKPR